MLTFPFFKKRGVSVKFKVLLACMICLIFSSFINCGEDEDENETKLVCEDDDDATDDDDMVEDDDNFTDDDMVGDDDTDDDSLNDDDAADDDVTDDDDAVGETWTDETTGLTWIYEPEDIGDFPEDAIVFCDHLKVNGFNDWRLPSISELRTLVRGCEQLEPGGLCQVTDECLEYSCWDTNCHICEPEFGPNNGCYNGTELGGVCGVYCSSSPVLDSGVGYWVIDFWMAHLQNAFYADQSPLYARCVRP